MPSLRDFRKTERVTVGDYWYEVKRTLSYSEDADSKACFLSIIGATEKLKKARDLNFTDTKYAIEDSKEAVNGLLNIWLAAWCYDEPLNSDEIRNLPQSHVDQILKAIAERVKGSIGTPETPLGIPSSDTQKES